MTQLVKSRKKKKPPLNIVATCGAGLEEIVAKEINVHGGSEIHIAPGAVSWKGTLESGYRMCLWSRFASRVLAEIARFSASDPDILYRQASKIDWEEHFNVSTTFAVFSTISDSPITHSKYAALRIKDAIVDQFRARTRKRPNVDLVQPGIRINLHLQGENATLALDLSGESLHRRGYRTMGVEAPLKETLAAGIVHLAGFDSKFPAENTFLDPMCGSGTLLIEAAMIYGDVAPGLQRKTFGFLSWKRHNQTLWKKLVDEALQREEEATNRSWPQILGFDADPQAVEAARKNIEAAGFDDRIQVSQGQFAFFRCPAANGMLIINPPYGERLADREQVKYLYRCIGRKLNQELDGWGVGFFAANPDLAGSLKMKWDKSINLYNGSIKCKLHTGTATKTPSPPVHYPTVSEPSPEIAGSDLAKQLLQNFSSLQPWLNEEKISCCRVYDADISEYNFSVDLYEEWAQIRAYPSQHGKGNAPKEASKRFQEGLNVVRNVFGVPPSRLFIQTSQIKKDKPRKEQTKRKKLIEVRDGACCFLVNFIDDHKSGLPLEQRSIRKFIGHEAKGKKFLNLYGSTGTATVHALMGGALGTTTVDGLPLNVQRTRANLALNGFGGPQHVTIQKDPLQWLNGCNERYGLILAVPPSHIKDRQGMISFDLQRDHEHLLQLAMQRLSREGTLLFSQSTPEFSLADSLQKDFYVQEVTEKMIPEDFKNNRLPLRCWEFHHRK